MALRDTKARPDHGSHERDRLFSILSHDLKNSLAAVMASAAALDRLAHTAPPDRIRTFAQLNADAARRASGLCEDLLAWARLQTSRVVMKEIDVRALIAGSVDAVREPARLQDIEVQVQPDHGALTARADRRAIETVLRNLLRNAIQFTPPGGRVAVSARAVNSRLVEIAVTDTGIGIEASRLPQLFTLAGAGPAPGADSARGPGIGLILCRELVERNEGRIAVTSRLQRGSRFAFVLPRADARATAEENPAKLEPAPAQAMLQGPPSEGA